MSRIFKSGFLVINCPPCLFGAERLSPPQLCLSCLQDRDMDVCMHKCPAWFVWETVSLGLCVSEVKGEGLESLCFCRRSRWGYRRKYEEEDILPQLCINTCFHTRTLFWNNFSFLLLFDPSLSLSSVHRNGREKKREMKRWGGRQFLSFSSLLSVFLLRTRWFVLSGICLAWLNKANCRVFVEDVEVCHRVCVCVCVNSEQCGLLCVLTSGGRDSHQGRNFCQTWPIVTNQN